MSTSMRPDRTTLGEAARLAALRRYAVLDGPADPSFERAVRLARRLFGVPMAVVSLVAEDRQVFRACVGLDLPGTPREVSFCHHAIADAEPLVVEDALQDPRFRTNPLVTGHPGVRFYAGAPLRTPDGLALGTLSVMDRVPRRFDEADRAALCDLAAGVVRELELRLEVARRESAEAAAREALARAYGTLDTIRDGLFALDGDFRFTYVNRRAEHFLERLATELVGQSLWTCFPELIGTPFEEGYRRAERTQRPVEVEAYWAPHDTWYEVRVYPHEEGYTVFLSDVTARKRTEFALVESEARYRQLVEGLHDVVFELDATGCWTFANPAWAWVAGRPPSEMVGTPFVEAFAEADRPALERLVARVLAGEPAGERLVVQLPVPHGEARTVELWLRPLHTDQGVVGAAGTLYDLTDARRVEAERRARCEAEEAGRLAEEARRQAEALLRAKASLLNTMGHELRTPLAGILGFAELLAMEGNEDQAEFARFIAQSGRRLLDTLNAILDLAQLEADGFVLVPEWRDLPGLLWEATAPWQSDARERGLAFSIDVHPEATEAHVDAEALRRVVGHLVSNAVRFTAAGSVRVEAEPVPEGLCLRVSDTGCGIEEGFLPFLFEPFRQGSEGLRRTHEGAGIGLTVTRRIVELMHGRIEVSSVPGVGSTFEVRLPCALRPGPEAVRSPRALRAA